MIWGWSLGLGRLFGIEIRVHWFFLLWIAVDVLRATFVPRISLAWTLQALGLLFLAVLLHEFGHCFAARRTGGSADRILLWPLGGLAETAVEHRPREQLITTLGGPAVNLAFVLAILPYIVATDQANSFLLRYGPIGQDPDLLATFWGVNLDLLMFNLLPALPLDGGRILHAVVWARTDEGTALEKSVLSSRLVAVAMALAGLFFFLSGGESGGILLGIAVLIWFSAEMEKRVFAERGEEESWLDFAEPRTRSSFRRWLDERRERVERGRRETQARERVAEKATLDELLEKVHRDGIDSLSRRERRFLEGVGKKLKDRDD